MDQNAVSKKLRRVARMALLLLFLYQTREDMETTVKLFREQAVPGLNGELIRRHFLAPLAFKHANIHVRKGAAYTKTLLESMLRVYFSSRTRRPVTLSDYYYYVAHLLLNVRNLLPPDHYWNDLIFVACYHRALGWATSTCANLDLLLQHPLAGPLTAARVRLAPTRQERIYDNMISQLGRGMPPPTKIRDLEVRRRYIEQLEKVQKTPEITCSVDLGYAIGQPRRWDRSQIRQRVALLDILTSHSTVAEAVDAWEANLKSRRIPDEERRAAAKALGIWNIRANQKEQWRERLGDELMSEYERLIHYAKAELPKGAWDYVTRVKFSERAVERMVELNLPALRKIFLLRASNKEECQPPNS